MENKFPYSLGLASMAPRRRQLLEMLDLPFTLAPRIDVDETYPETLAPRDGPLYLAQRKAKAYRKLMRPNDLYITADTVVILDDKVLGKPADNDEAVRMLEALSGKTHEVVTGVTLSTIERMESFSALTEVEFAAIPSDEIRTYVAKYHPLDKAGAYGIQEWIGAIGIRGIKGSFYNVMGLPVHRLWEALKVFQTVRNG